VLVVDDDPDIRLLIRVTLESAGYWVIGEAENGAAAIWQTFKLNPTIIVMDEQMPHLTGRQATYFINEVRPETKVVVVSAVFNDAPEWGAAFVSKFRIPELPEALDRLFDDENVHITLE
jgi:DNA-binding NarL/FixJ family response regulator